MSIFMNAQENDDLENCLALLESCHSLQLATVDEKGLPHISYAPFIRQREHFFIFVSQLAGHTKHLQLKPNASIMVIQDETASRNLFARERCILNVLVEAVASDVTASILDQMEIELGKTIGLLRALPDFVLYRLTSAQARYVAGFGKTYEVDLIRNELVHVSEKRLAER
jgi:putative heme iron utilization protein